MMLIAHLDNGNLELPSFAGRPCTRGKFDFNRISTRELHSRRHVWRRSGEDLLLDELYRLSAVDSREHDSRWRVVWGQRVALRAGDDHLFINRSRSRCGDRCVDRRQVKGRADIGALLDGARSDRGRHCACFSAPADHCPARVPAC